MKAKEKRAELQKLPSNCADWKAGAEGKKVKKNAVNVKFLRFFPVLKY